LKKLKLFTVIILLLIILSGCKGTDYSNDNPAPITGDVYGRIVDSQGNSLLNVEVKLNNKSTRTNANGAFAFNDIDKGTYNLEISQHKVEEPEPIKDKGIYRFHFDLNKEIVVTDDETDLGDLKVSPAVIIKDVDKYYNDEGFLTIIGRYVNNTNETMDRLEIYYMVIPVPLEDNNDIKKWWVLERDIKPNIPTNWQITTEYTKQDDKEENRHEISTSYNIYN
jgi:hypothetical protein